LEESVLLAYFAQPTCCCAFEAHGEFIVAAVKVVLDRHHAFGSIRRGGCADVRYKVTDQDVRFMPHGRNHGNRHADDGADYTLEVEGPQVLC
tara:strand:+ start:42 stop:317 length:276 start_codon:yes stop_codon:yes gene_type:complete